MPLAEIFGPDLLIVVLVIVAVLFGGAAIPKLARNLGSAQSEFKKGMAEGGNTDEKTDAKEATEKVTTETVTTEITDANGKLSSEKTKTD